MCRNISHFLQLVENKYKEHKYMICVNTSHVNREKKSVDEENNP